MSRYLPDVNVWVALTLKGHVHHTAALDWFNAIEKERSIAFCRQTQAGLLRLLTTHAVMAAHRLPAFSNADAWKILMSWTGQPTVFFADEPVDLEERWRSLAAIRSASPKIWMDTYLAAFTSCSGFRMVTNDRAFLQFKGMDTMVLGHS